MSNKIMIKRFININIFIKFVFNERLLQIINFIHLVKRFICISASLKSLLINDFFEAAILSV